MLSNSMLVGILGVHAILQTTIPPTYSWCHAIYEIVEDDGNIAL